MESFNDKLRVLLKHARRVAFLGAHKNDRDSGQALLDRELDRLYRTITDYYGNEEPDLTFCCGCSEEIDLEAGEEQWVLDGAKFHKLCYQNAIKQLLVEPHS